MTARLAATLALLAGGAAAQEAPGPLSAIDWLADSVAFPVEVAPPVPDPQEAPIDAPGAALPEEITVTPLGQVLPDAAGLLAPEVTGLPRTLWGSSASADLARQIEAMPERMPPAARELFLTLMLAELDPPMDATADGELLLARIDALVRFGALEQAAALLERAGTESPRLFQRGFDIALLLGNDGPYCRRMIRQPSLAPSYPARIWCLAREGDWDLAALTLETGHALELLSAADEAILARFLDPELADDLAVLPPPQRPSPLAYRLHEAVGEPIPSGNLPLAFAHGDLGEESGWRAQLAAAERLVRAGALDENSLLGLYTERKPAASGGIWDRVAAVQALDAAIAAGDAEAARAAVDKVWAAARAAGLEVPFARLFAAPLAELEVDGEAAENFGLLSPGAQATARTMDATRPGRAFLREVALGRAGEATAPPSPMAAAVREGFAAEAPPERYTRLVAENRMGEAILTALADLARGAAGDPSHVAGALAQLRAAGAEDLARRAAIELLLVGRAA